MWDRAVLANEIGQINIIRPVPLTAFGPDDVMFLQSSDAQTHANFDVDLGAGAAEIMEALGEPQEAWKTLFPSHPRPFALTHSDPALSNILVNPATFRITGI